MSEPREQLVLVVDDEDANRRLLTAGLRAEGYRVETTDGRALGDVAETFSTGINDVWVVRDQGREHLIPAIADVVKLIDREGRRIVIDPLPGLLDT